MAERIVLEVLKGRRSYPPPIWMMRQAGRYLPEYKQVRAKAGSFLNLCYNPDLASEVTLQPIRRFGFDAAILFSDILVVPHAMGRKVDFVEGRGPVLEPIDEAGVLALVADAGRLDGHLAPVYETVARLRSELPAGTTLLGFCGAPWTVATYMIAGHGTSDQAPARLFHYRHPQAMERLLMLLAELSAHHLERQIENGADAVQIFDSWAGVLDEEAFEACCVKPVAAMVARIRKKHPHVPIIGFPRGAASRYRDYRQRTRVDVLGLDWTVPGDFAAQLQKDGAVQGNLDPLRLVAGGKALDDGVEHILRSMGSGPLVFNLGHGITPETPIAHVEAMIERVRRG